jgi:glucose/mannose transport system permease protein
MSRRAEAAMAPISNTVARRLVYLVLVIFAIYYLAPLYVMVVNSLKSLDEIREGGILSPPTVFTLEAWIKAWDTAQVGVTAGGLKIYFLNSVEIVVPAVILSTLLGALNGYVLTKWRFRGDGFFFGMILLACFVPYQMILIPMARTLGFLGLQGTIAGLVLVHVVYGIGFTTLFFRNYYAAFPNELIRSAHIDGAGFFRILWYILLPNSGPIIVVSVIWQFTNIWNDFLFGVTFGGFNSMPLMMALNNLVNTSTSVKEYNVDFAGAILAALPTLVVYVVSGRYFVRGLMSGAVKG